MGIVGGAGNITMPRPKICDVRLERHPEGEAPAFVLDLAERAPVSPRHARHCNRGHPDEGARLRKRVRHLAGVPEKTRLGHQVNQQSLCPPSLLCVASDEGVATQHLHDGLGGGSNLRLLSCACAAIAGGQGDDIDIEFEEVARGLRREALGEVTSHFPINRCHRLELRPSAIANAAEDDKAAVGRRWPRGLRRKVPVRSTHVRYVAVAFAPTQPLHLHYSHLAFLGH
mmetsp:Transcript_55588/g.119604  ORF Transcript_55588/g.119604 Transcript_55588/m.119604 type:complete len:228 (+) Transcript_55588:1266-1949(+)